MKTPFLWPLPMRFCLITVLLAVGVRSGPAQGLEKRSSDTIKQMLKKIEATSAKAAKGDRNVAAELTTLNKYRYLCGVPCDVEIKPEFSALAQAASKICSQLGQITHTPSNPGFPQAEYDQARQGAAQSNLSMGANETSRVLMFMYDSDPMNINRVGHRRWCLNPAMRYTGFGFTERFGAMYSFDASRETVPDYDFIAFPPPGLMPADMITGRHAWHVSFSPDKYQVPDAGDLKIVIQPLRHGDMIPKMTIPSERGLAIDDLFVNQDGMGIPNAVIFRSSEIKPSRGKRYAVYVFGLKDSAGQPKPFSYAVEFF